MHTVNSDKTNQSRLLDIDCAKGLAIILVVFGHLVMREQPLGNEWYEQLRIMIYAFHMPFFMYLSGFIMFYTKAAYVKPDAFFDYIRKRAYRLLVPFFFMGFLIFIGKNGASLFISVDNKPNASLDGLIPLFWNTHASPAISLWFIFVAFIYGILVPLSLWIFKNKIAPLFTISILLYVLPLPEYMYLDKIGQYFVFFVMGGIAAIHFDKYYVFIDKWRYALFALFITSLGLTFLDMNWILLMAIVGCLSLPALHAFVRIPKVMNSKILLSLGKYAFVIYLFNTIMIGLAKGVMFKFMTWHGINFLAFVPVLLGAGLIAPIILKAFILNRIPALKKLTN